MIGIKNSEWNKALKGEYEKEYFHELISTVDAEYNNNVIYPEKENIFAVFESVPLSKVRVVILGQDPYHGEKQACGLSFSVSREVPVPKSLRNIYKELHDDVGCGIPTHGDISSWCTEGVFLLNTVLTVKAHQPNSHKGIGWEQFTDAVIRILNQQNHSIVFILWGKHAQEKEILLDNPMHYIIKSPHPSPFSANKGFFGSKPFSKTNEFFAKNGQEKINWNFINN